MFSVADEKIKMNYDYDMIMCRNIEYCEVIK